MHLYITCIQLGYTRQTHSISDHINFYPPDKIQWNQMKISCNNVKILVRLSKKLDAKKYFIPFMTRLACLPALHLYYWISGSSSSLHECSLVPSTCNKIFLCQLARSFVRIPLYVVHRSFHETKKAACATMQCTQDQTYPYNIHFIEEKIREENGEVWKKNSLA